MTKQDSNQTTRRQFVAGSTTAAVSAALAANIAIPRAAYAQSSEEIRIALIGCGGRGSGAAGQALATEGKVKIVAMGDAFEDRLNGSLEGLVNKFKNDKQRVEVANDSKYVGFDAYRKIIDRTDIDLVILTTPPGFRPMHFEYAIQKGKHVFMEKPVATDATGVRKVLAAAELAKKKNLKVGVGLQRHHQAQYIETVGRIKDGAIGDLTHLRCYWNGNRPWNRGRGGNQTEMEYQMRNWYYFNWICGDHICEQHIHNLDVCNWLMEGYPVEANGQGGRQNQGEAKVGEIFDHHFVEFTYANGVKMWSQCRHIGGCWNEVDEYAHGTKGWARVGGHIRLNNGEEWRARGGKNPYQQEHDDLFDAIRNNKPFNEAENGAKSTMTSIFGRMATYSGKIVKWDDAINSKVDEFPHDPNFKWSWDAKPPTVPGPDGEYPVPMQGRSKVV